MAKDLSSFLDQLALKTPQDFLKIDHPVNPHEFEVTAVLEHLTRKGRRPVTLFRNPYNLYGEISEIALVSNVFSERKRCAVALECEITREINLTMEFACLTRQKVQPQVVERAEAPVKEVSMLGEKVDLRFLPIVRHYEMDLGPVITMAVAMKDPDNGAYDISFVKTFFKGPKRLGVCIHSPHLLKILSKYEERNLRAPIINILGHHPAFYLGALALTPYGTNDYETVGSFLREPLRLVGSETWGDDFLVPADAEIVIEGEIPPGTREIVNPFGEVTRYYQAQCLRPVMEVTAITRKNRAIMQDIFSGHEEHWNLGGIPKEGSIYERLKSMSINVKAVHCPHSGAGRLSCYISIEKNKEGEAKKAALAALLETEVFQVVVVVDSDVNVYDEKEVIWAVLTRTDPMRDVSLIANMHSGFMTAMGHNKVIIDATAPLDRAFPAVIAVPEEVMKRVRLEKVLGPTETAEG